VASIHPTQAGPGFSLFNSASGGHSDAMNTTAPSLEKPALPFALRRNDDLAVVSVFTLVLWLFFVGVGLAGWVLSYDRPRSSVQRPPTLAAELVNVELTADPLPQVKTAPRVPTPIQPPPSAPPVIVPAAPPMLAVAAPSPQIAFAVPVSAPAQVVPVKEASYRTVETPVVEPAPAAPGPQPLTFGQGEGKQPAPDYPRQALREGQEGIVTVRMTVGEDGRVLSAEAASPSPWPLLNQAALRVVKSRWRFTPGSLRAYQVAIRFQLSK
jgi:protein TonB